MDSSLKYLYGRMEIGRLELEGFGGGGSALYTGVTLTFSIYSDVHQ